MNSGIFILTMCFVFVSVLCNAQVKKGYYSIGNNVNKLNSQPAIKTSESNILPAVNKGYYSLNSNRQKLVRLYKLEYFQNRVPVVKKGYYSIGANE
jgi:hypothetical protein